MTITIDLPAETLTALKADARAQGRLAEEVAAEYLASLYVAQDDEEQAINEALQEVEAGQGRPVSEFAKELSTRFTARYGAA